MSQETNTNDWRAGLGARLDRQDEQMQKVIKRADDQAEQIDSIRGELQLNTATTKRIETDTSELLRMFNDVKGGFRFLAVMGSVLKWAAGIAASLVALWLAIKGGDLR